jgi:YegS/Rv2252/BmrU family lipid kinase
MTHQTSITHVAILANLKAGGGKAMQIANWLGTALTKQKISYAIFNDQWPNEVLLNSYSDCWIIGGDGTINYFINQYTNCKINLALFNSGTGNDFAWKLYGDSNLAERFSQVIHATPKDIDAGVVNNKLYINCMGVGFDGEIIKYMRTIRFLGGKLGYMLAVIIKILGFKEKEFSIQTEQVQFHGKYLLALIVNSSRAGGGFYIAPNANINDGKLDMVLCEALPVWKRLIYLPIIKKGKHMHLPFVKQSLGKAFTIQCKEEMPIQVDGELIYAKDIQVKVLESQFKFRF